MRWALAHTPTYPARPHLPHHQRPHLPAPPPPPPTQDFFESGATAAAPATAAVLPKPKVAVAGAKPGSAASASEVSSAITLKGAQLAWAILHRARLQARREPRGVPHVSGVVCSTHRASNRRRPRIACANVPRNGSIDAFIEMYANERGFLRRMCADLQQLPCKHMAITNIIKKPVPHIGTVVDLLAYYWLCARR